MTDMREHRDYGLDVVKFMATLLAIFCHIVVRMKWIGQPDATQQCVETGLFRFGACCINLFGFATGYLCLYSQVKT